MRSRRASISDRAVFWGTCSASPTCSSLLLADSLDRCGCGPHGHGVLPVLSCLPEVTASTAVPPSVSEETWEPVYESCSIAGWAC